MTLNCLIVTSVANEFAAEIDRLADLPISVKACTSAEQAVAEYTDESILFGNPSMIAAILPTMPTVRWVQSAWAGVTPLIALGRRDYVLTGVKNVFGPQISEYVIGYLLAHELRVIERMAAQHERKWDETDSGTLQGKRLGIMGTGSIGGYLAKAASCFGMRVTGLNRSGAMSSGFDTVMAVERLHEFLAGIDYLVSTLPQTPGTDDLLGAEALAKLPSHAYFINVGRGNVVDDDALIDALRNRTLAGAALDVFDEEPVPADSPLWDAPNLSITAHIAAVSHPSHLVPVFIKNYRHYTNNEPLEHVIDFDTGY